MPISTPSATNGTKAFAGRKKAATTISAQAIRRAQDGPPGAPPAGDPAEEQRAAEGDELHEEDQRDQLALAKFSSSVP